MVITNSKELRRAFWREHSHLSREKIPHYSGNGTMFRTDTRVAWTDYKDALAKAGVISQGLMETATLK